MKFASSPIENSTSSYFFDSNRRQESATPWHKTARYKTQQAVIERGWDAKIGERRGGDF
jgi:hypothetical protein